MRRACTLLLAMLALACRDSAPQPAAPDPAAPVRVAAATPGPIVTIVDSLVLQEPADTPLGGFTMYWGISAGGQILVTDISNNRVVVFGQDGRFLHTLGRRGGGPGEFDLPATVLTNLADDRVGVLDLNRSRLLLFDLASGEFVREIVTPFQHIGMSTARDGDALVVAPIGGATPLVLWDLAEDLFEPLGTRSTYFIPGSQSVVMSVGVPGVVRHGTGWLLWEPGYGLSLLQSDGSHVDAVVVPASRRRGEGAALVQRQMNLIRDRKLDVALSGAMGIGTLAGGEVVLASGDFDQVGEDRRSARRANLRIYLTVLDAALERGCLDGLVPLQSDVEMAPLFRGDTVSVLTRVVADDGTVRTMVYTLRIDLTGCEWVELGR
ncbi:MAG: 6-bladed beta-propeller [Gemmatimonadales bacterium]|nr:6-bladed beta-propeller [Gemmatimonadales bacterium]